MAGKNLMTSIEQPGSLGSFSNWIRILWNSKGIDWKFLPRILSVSLSTFFTSPLRLYERLRYGNIVKNTVMHPSPIFIVGHWRTGTTHLHNLMTRDKSFGYLTTFQAMAPGFCLAGEKIFKPLLAKLAKMRHPTRIIDNIPLSLDLPQEEDYAIANISPYSFLHLYTLPRQAVEYFERYTLFDHLPDSVCAKWTEIYLTILRKTTIMSKGKRLILKNPAHCGRIGTLLNLFPDAKFIHIYRNPYNVFCSTLFVYRTVLPQAQIQEISEEQIKTYILQFYAQLMQKFLREKSLIPAENLVEVKYEDLEEAPLAQVRKIYERLDLPGFSEVEPALHAYLASIEGYQKNKYEIDDEVIDKVNQHWRFAFDEWGYSRLEPGCGK